MAAAGEKISTRKTTHPKLGEILLIGGHGEINSNAYSFMGTALFYEVSRMTGTDLKTPWKDYYSERHDHSYSERHDRGLRSIGEILSFYDDGLPVFTTPSFELCEFLLGDTNPEYKTELKFDEFNFEVSKDSGLFVWGVGHKNYSFTVERAKKILSTVTSAWENIKNLPFDSLVRKVEREWQDIATQTALSGKGFLP